MTYVYYCKQCKHVFDVIKSVKDIDVNESCPKCGEFAERQFVPQSLHIVGASVEHAEYNPGLGCIVKNKKHRAEIAKQRGLIEIGNEKPEKIHKKFDQERQEKLSKPYDEDL